MLTGLRRGPRGRPAARRRADSCASRPWQHGPRRRAPARRLIVRDSQGITGKKVELYSLPYSRIDMRSSENAGHLDFNAEMELWTRAGHIKIKLGRGVDVRRLDNLISQMVLGAR